MNLVHIVAILAVLQFFYFGILVARARRKYGVQVPAVTGNLHFDYAFRVQMNTLEQMIAFLPALFIAAQYWSGLLVAGIGVIYLIGRFLYARSYVIDPARRSLGFLLTVTPTFVLLALGLFGALVSSR